MADLQLDRDWARKCADAYTANPTPARAHNAAQHLPQALAEIERLEAVIAGLAPVATGGE